MTMDFLPPDPTDQQVREHRIRLWALGKERTDIGIRYASPARMRKKDNPNIGAIKVQVMECVVNFDYESEVNDRWEAEGLPRTFAMNVDRKWGHHMKGTCLIEHKRNFYVQVFVKKSDVFYWLRGTEISPEISPFLFNASDFPVRDLKLDHITNLTISF